MADFLEDEAEEVSSGEEDDDMDETSPKQKLTKKRRKAIEDDDDDEEDDDALDDEAKKELADFIQDEPIDEEPQDEERKRKRSDDEEDVDLEEDDYELIEENLGMKVKRGPKFRRVRPMEGDESEDEGNDRDAIANQLFDGDDGGDDDQPKQSSALPKRPNDRAPRLHATQDEDMDDDMEDDEGSDEDSFIVDDEGKPIHSHKARGARRFDDAALQEAQDIFGLDFDVGDLEEGDEDEEDYEEEDEDGEMVRHIRRKKNRKSVLEVYEPSDLEHNLKTQADNAIRLLDMPERFQLRSIPVAPPSQANAVTELLVEARWIHQRLFEQKSLSHQSKGKKMLRSLTVLQMPSGKDKEKPADGAWGANETEAGWGGAQATGWPAEKSSDEPATFDTETLESRTMKIKEILDFMRNQSLEDVFIATYRKEFYYPDFNPEDLNQIYEADLIWMQLQRRRANLVKLMTKMQEYLCLRLLDNAEFGEGGSLVTDEAIQNAREANSIVELADYFDEFKMIYGRHLPSMHKEEAQKQPIEDVLDENGVPIDPERAAEAKVETAGVKRALRTDPYIIYKQAGLDKFVEKFGLNAEQLAGNVEVQYEVNKIQQEPLDPEILAEGFTSARFPTVSDVLKGAVSMMALLIARNARFRRSARRFFMENAVINVSATQRGLKEIDESHACYKIKYLKNKPITDLADDQYLKLIRAQKDGLVIVKLQMPRNQNGQDPFLAMTTPYLTVDEFTKEVNAWNSLRVMALEKAITVLVYPAMEKEAHEELLVEAKSYVKAEIRRKLYSALNVAPYTLLAEKLEKDAHWEEGPWDLTDGVRVMGIAYEDNRDSPGYAAVVNCYGEILESVKLPSLFARRNDRARVNPEDIGKIMDLFSEKKPHVVAIASENRRALDIRQAILDGMKGIKMDDRTFHEDVGVEIVDNRVSILYGNSESGRMEFPSFPPVLRQAISVARRLLDPLVTYAQLYNMDDDILNLNFHPLQNELSKEEFRNALQIEFVKRVNEVGVDLNECVSHPLTHGSLVQFICGLGPRKAQHLMKVVKQNGVLVSRNQLVMTCRLGPKVFVNCAGFIKINANELSDSITGEQYVEPLDASRVHPEHYEWARKMAVDALDFDESEEGANPSDALQEILEHPEKLGELDLAAFGEELAKMDNRRNPVITLNVIQQELHSRFKETRQLFHSPSPAEIFEMIVGVPVKDYRRGLLVTATVYGFLYNLDRPPPDVDPNQEVMKVPGGNWYCHRCLEGNRWDVGQEVYDHFLGRNDLNNNVIQPPTCPGWLAQIKVSLDNNIMGMIPIKYLTDKEKVYLIKDRVKIGMVVSARLLCEVDPEKFFVKELTCKSTDLKDSNNVFKEEKDQYYDHETEHIAMDREIKKHQKQAPKTNFLKRVIAHPSFKNVNFEDSERYLSQPTVAPGEAVIRPSSKGNNKLSLSWKVANGIHDHAEITERDKENAFSLGRLLVIGDENFDDLDEILARYVQPMAQLVAELVQYKYYVDSHNGQLATREMQREVIDRWLRAQKALKPNQVPFCFSALVSSPRRYFLCHLPRENVREEFFTVTPTGYQYRRQMFSTLGHLIKFFKEHYHEPPPMPMGNTPHPSVTPGMSMMITPGITPRQALRPGSNLTAAADALPSYVRDRLNAAVGSSRGTPGVFATPRTPSGSVYNPGASVGQASTPSGITPSGATPNSMAAAPWGRAAQMWQKAMVGPANANTPGTPGSIPATPGSTNWAVAAQEWVTKDNKTTGNPPPR